MTNPSTSNPVWEALEERFWSSDELAIQEEMARQMVTLDPSKAWELLKKGLRARRTRASIAGLLVLRDRRTGPLLLKTIHARGGNDEEIEALVQALGELADVDALCQLINDPFGVPRVQLLALQALSKHHDEQAVSIFLRELHASSRTRQELATITLGRWRVKKVVPTLCKRLRSQLHTSLRKPLVFALANIGTPDAIAGVRELLFHEKEQLRVETAEQVAQFAHVEWLPLLQACREKFEGVEDETWVGRIDLAIERHQEVMAKHQQEKIEPWIAELESVLWDS
ncbi:MAG TPA: hypothetical protein DCE42_08195 [Myxococcales bacterium]|nr:hypothetical protein [Myxococcales bacterium]